MACDLIEIQTCFSGVSTKIDPIKDFSLDLGPVTLGERQPTSLYECLEKYTKAEHLGSTRMCSNCGSYQESTKQLTLKTLPIVVSFHLKRFLRSEEVSLFNSPLSIDISLIINHIIVAEYS